MIPNLKGAKRLQEIFSPKSIIDLGPADLVIAPQLESVADVIKLKVYEREHYFLNPNSIFNEGQLAEYLTCSSCFSQAVAEIRELYEGWSKIDKTEPAKVIGIHNQNPKILYIQFSHGKRYFIYKRCLTFNRDMGFEELFGKNRSDDHCPKGT